MSNPSKTPPLFAQSAQDILERLKEDRGYEADSMRKEAKELLDLFLKWVDERPESQERLDAISRLFTLYRRMLDFRLKK